MLCTFWIFNSMILSHATRGSPCTTDVTCPTLWESLVSCVGLFLGCRVFAEAGSLAVFFCLKQTQWSQHNEWAIKQDVDLIKLFPSAKKIVLQLLVKQTKRPRFQAYGLFQGSQQAAMSTFQLLEFPMDALIVSAGELACSTRTRMHTESVMNIKVLHIHLLH